jgi:hypothetical protein
MQYLRVLVTPLASLAFGATLAQVARRTGAARGNGG